MALKRYGLDLILSEQKLIIFEFFLGLGWT